MIFNYISIGCLVLLIFCIIYINVLENEINELEEKQKNVNLAFYEAIRTIGVDVRSIKNIVRKIDETTKETNKEPEGNNK